MIARYYFLLPYTFSVKNGSTFSVQEFKRERYTIRLHPPQQCKVETGQFDVAKGASVDELADRIRPVELLEANNRVLLDGLSSIDANLILVEFHGREFRRSKETIDFTDIDPPITEALEIANLFVIRYRALIGDSGITPLKVEDVIWRIDYLNDEGGLMPRDPRNELVNRLQGTRGSFTCHGLDPAIWNAIFALNEDWNPQAWRMLLLDAQNLLPDINAALVLAAASLETYISERLQSLAARSSLLTDQLKKLLARNPSTAAKFDVLLMTFTGYSLKNDKQLWDGYGDLRKARNRIAHSGKALRTEVTPTKVKELIGVAHAVITRVEEHLPLDLRALRFDSALKVELRMRVKIGPGIVRNELQVKPVVPERTKNS